MAGSSRDYWINREREAKKATIRDQEAYKKSIEDIYKRTYEAVERQINDWYAKYASKNGMTMAQARSKVKKLDMERYERLAAKYVATHDFSDQANEEMEIYNLTMRINRLELLKAQINLELLAGYDDLDHEMQRQLIEQAMKEDRRLAGILGDSVIGNLEYAKQLVNASFQNATFSERIWGNNMPKLRSHIETELRNGIIQGIHPRELARRLRKSFDVSVADSERLMVTETRRIQTDIQKASFERNGFTEYRFITTGDERVCPDCEALHEQHFKVSEMQPGENAPPMHPSCRCSTAAYMDGEKYKRWLEALERGEDVRWNEIEDRGERLYPQSNTPIFNDVERTASELEKVAREIKNDMRMYAAKPSKWSGNVRTVSDASEMPAKGVPAYKDWTCDIVVLPTITDYIMWHEMLHSASVSYYDEECYYKHRDIEESSVELLAREACKAKGIKTGPGYQEEVEILLSLREYLGYKSDLQFAKELYNQPLPKRYDWLEELLRDKMIQKGIDAKQINNDIEYLRKALGGNKIAEKNIFSKSPSGAL